MSNFLIGLGLGLIGGVLAIVIFVEPLDMDAWKYRQVCVEYKIDKPADCAKLGPGLARKGAK